MTNLQTTARITGFLYLGLGVTGMLGFMTIRPMLYNATDAATTLANLAADPYLAQIGVALELGVVLTQALVAFGFYRLFRTVDNFAAGAIAGFGMMNAAAILVSSMFLAAAQQIAVDPGMGLGEASAGTAQLMYELSSAAWSGGGLFFGLWLIPMGYVVLVSNWMPRVLGYILVAGGIGYVLSAFAPLLPESISGTAEMALALLATVGELWMIGYLLSFGVRSTALTSEAAEATPLAA